MRSNGQGKLLVSSLRQPMDFFERRFLGAGFSLIAGIDEAGRGPLAGPVVAAAVVLRFPGYTEGLRDSKQLRPDQRESLYEKIMETAHAVGVGVVEAQEIDRIHIGRATQKAMSMAVECLPDRPDLLLIDGISPIPLPIPQRTLVKGDCLSVSIAAASIVAKVSRDRIMISYHEKYPQYNFAKHKGYGTREHFEVIRKHGCCECHRRSFRGVVGASPEPPMTDPSEGWAST